MQPANPTTPHPSPARVSAPTAASGGDIAISMFSRRLRRGCPHADESAGWQTLFTNSRCTIVVGIHGGGHSSQAQNLLKPLVSAPGMACAPAARLAVPSKPRPGFRWRSVLSVGDRSPLPSRYQERRARIRPTIAPTCSLEAGCCRFSSSKRQCAKCRASRARLAPYCVDPSVVARTAAGGRDFRRHMCGVHVLSHAGARGGIVAATSQTTAACHLDNHLERAWS
jgi:hypothetical protein